MILDSISHVLPGCLPASFRGIGFFVPDASSEPGRRVAEHLFPGTDRAAYDDHGLLPNIVTLDGILVGDDYVAQARALEAAFERAGPGTLVHPWLGAMTVILVDPAEISFSAAELRVARFTASFTRIRASGFGGLFGGFSTASALLGAVTSLVSSARALAMSPETLTPSRARPLAAQRSGRLLRDSWLALPAGRATPVIRAAVAGALPSSPAAFGQAIGAASGALLGMVSEIAGTPAVSPAAESPASFAMPAAEALRLLLDAAGRMLDHSADAPSPTDRAMLIAAAAEPLAQAARLSAYISHESRPDAMALRSTLITAAGGVVEATDALDATLFAAPGSVLRLDVDELRTRIVADINEAIGRLPALTVLETTREADAWLVANHFYGDRPETIEAGHRSIVSRNRPRHPAQLPAGRIEVLK